MTAGLFYNMIALTSLYLTYPVSVSVSVVNEPRLQFPAVTICNVNPINKTAWTLFQAASASVANVATPEPGVRRKRKKRALGVHLMLINTG